MLSFTQPSIASFDDMKQKIEAYLNVYDGTVKPYQEMQHTFEGLFHEKFSHTMDGRPIDKDQMRETVRIFLSIGTKADLILYNPLDDCTFEVKLHIVNRLADLQTHSKGTIQGGQLIKLEAYEDAQATYKNGRKSLDSPR